MAYCWGPAFIWPQLIFPVAFLLLSLRVLHSSQTPISVLLLFLRFLSPGLCLDCPTSLFLMAFKAQLKCLQDIFSDMLPSISIYWPFNASYVRILKHFLYCVKTTGIYILIFPTRYITIHLCNPYSI